MSDSVESVDKGKRAILTLGTIAIGAGIGGAVGLNVLNVAISKAIEKGAEGGEKNWLELGSVSEFPEDVPTPKKVSITVTDGWVKSSSDEAVWVVRKGETVLTFTATCPHLGCKVNWIGKDNQYFCPCHNSYFEKEGALKQPSAAARGLDELENRVVNGKVEVVFKRYKGLLAIKEEFS